MATSEHTLTGFDDFLERRRFAFVEPIPATRVCGICSLVPSRSVLLPCGHVLCQLCKGQIGNEAMCPQCPSDGLVFSDEDVVTLNFSQCDVEKRRVLCVAGGPKCGFTGTLLELRGHLAHCDRDEATCPKCQRFVVRNVFVDHYRQCTDGTFQCQGASGTGPPTTVEKLGAIKKDVETLRRLASEGDPNQQSAYVNVANSLMERVAELERELLQVRKGAGGVEQNSPLQAFKVPIVPGPFRAASKPGVFVTTCVFKDVHAMHNSVKAEKKERKIASDVCTLGGYTFRVRCHLCPDESQSVRISFVLFLQCGEWDDHVAWPFSKSVTLILTNPVDAAKDVRLPLSVGECHGSSRKPVPGICNTGYKTEDIEWNYVLRHGYVGKNKLYVNVEFE